MRFKNTLAPLGVTSILSFFGCAEAVPPELVDARAAYERAAQGPAQDLNPADLHVAKTSLQEAELAFDEDGDSMVTRDLAYVAERRAQIAEAKARTIAATREAERLAARSDRELQQQYAQTSAQLEAARRQLEQNRDQLAAEQQRRAEAEKRAQQAMNDLARVAAVKEEARGTVITLSGSVLFESGKSDLRPVATGRLAQVADALTQNDPDSRIVVEGYTDSQGSQKFNEKLSQERAEAVREFLVERGVAPDRIQAQGLGPAKPIADNGSPEGRANNRRVEIVVQPPRAGKPAEQQTSPSPSGV